MATNVKNNQAIVLHSGGQDSTTCLAWAIKEFKKVEVISFDYGQRHKIELKGVKKICESLQIPYQIIKIDILKELTKNALTDKKIQIKAGKKGQLPSTFVEGRNLIFLSTVAIIAKTHHIPHLVIGVCQTDYSGYPDCREDFIKSLQKTLRLAMDYPFKIHTPLMHLTKGETVKLMQKLGRLELLKYSHTCYEGKRLACKKCPACKLRLKGFNEAGVEDPIAYA
ncbi:7-cyano-7-deazaguanine synthase QueC [Candidatus Peregrinibacteria bacterium CG_4_10_14_0_2_um_filter_43_11]|nr:MAG: 7-cyano-7-deazaguanine synthase QueC [Candidatus Peregrinibacteria bacterium CG_4_10_14_0_2_um_filter_43_11]